jgi:dynein heavy chain
LNQATREWQDGLFSCITRNLACLIHENPKWIVLDADIDPNWVEPLNTVMDDNKVLTLASNERIPLTTYMRLVFEISHMKYATPATVSRAGILFINDTDVGFMTYAYSWIDKRTNGNEKSQLTVLFNNYVPRTIEMIHAQIKHIVPLPDIAMVITLCRLLERFLTKQNVRANAEASLYELYFVFVTIWTFGGACDDQDRDFRAAFRCGDQSGETLHFRSRGQFSIPMLVRTRRNSFHGLKSARRSSMFRGEVPGPHLSLH